MGDREGSEFIYKPSLDGLAEISSVTIYLCMFLGRNHRAGQEDKNVIEKEEGKIQPSPPTPQPFVSRKSESPAPLRTYMWPQSMMNFLHFGNGQSESSLTIYRNFEMENTWSVLLKMQETHFGEDEIMSLSDGKLTC